ncbi:MAG: integrating conjugative element protein [Candidatus Competibacteraceae bacterium]
MRLRLHVLFIAGGLTPVLALADPVIRYDSGQSVPLAPSFQTLAPTAEPVPSTRPRPAAVIDRVTAPLPVVTPELTPGVAAPRPGPLPLTRPLFLVGADTLSLHWLAARREYLRQLGAVGLLVQASAPTDLAAVRAVAGDLPILPMPGSDLARYLGIAHYPVLITPGGVAP